jgi:hypothetical protein
MQSIEKIAQINFDKSTQFGAADHFGYSIRDLGAWPDESVGSPRNHGFTTLEDAAEEALKVAQENGYEGARFFYGATNVSFDATLSGGEITRDRVSNLVQALTVESK